MIDYIMQMMRYRTDAVVVVVIVVVVLAFRAVRTLRFHSLRLRHRVHTFLPRAVPYNLRQPAMRAQGSGDTEGTPKLEINLRHSC